MKFPDPLVRGRLLRRYKRFLADVELESGEVATVHCANPGSMLGLTAPGSVVWLSPSRNPERKLRWSWELIEVDGHLVGINTGHPNALVEEAVAAGAIAELAGYEAVRREVRYGKNSRIDLLLESADKAPCYVEVKNVHLKRHEGLAEFPDSVTKRGAKHLEELGDTVAAGARAVMFYLVQRPDCTQVSIAADIDPAYDAGLRRAVERGVEAICYDCDVAADGIEVARRLPLVL
jgi:sugar fermentation stimulation protein A